jgi:uncharacterized protein YciI
LVIALLGCCSILLAQDRPAPPTTQPAAMQFESYQVVILRAGDNAAQISREQVMEIQKQHLAHLHQMGEAGKMVIAGPFGDQQDRSFRGMCIYRVGSIDEARKLAEDDPAVKAGRLRVEVMTWYVEKGYMTFPKAPPAP